MRFLNTSAWSPLKWPRSWMAEASPLRRSGNRRDCSSSGQNARFCCTSKSTAAGSGRLRARTGFLKVVRHSPRVSLLLGLLSVVLHAQYVTTRLFTHPPRTAAFLPAVETLVYAGYVAPAPDGSVYLTSLGSGEIFRINPADGLWEPFAGSGSAILAPGDCTPAILAGSLSTTALAVDPAGIVYRV